MTPPTLVARRIRGISDQEAGFSLVELMVVLLVLGILLVIAIPTFLGTQNAADDRSAQSNLSTAITDAKSQFQSNGQTYLINNAPNPAQLATNLGASEPSLQFKAGNAGRLTSQGSSGSLSSISVAVSVDGNGLVLAAYSVPGNCFYVVDNAQTITGASLTAPSPYTGNTAVTTSPVHAPAGTIGLPTAAGTSYVEVSGDVNQQDCNANTPMTSGPPATIQYLTSSFPS